MTDYLPYAVIDTVDHTPGHVAPVLGRFATEDEASAFIEQQPDYQSGRYAIDGPER